MTPDEFQSLPVGDSTFLPTQQEIQLLNEDCGELLLFIVGGGKHVGN